jgi:hypothetical protein
MEAYLIPSVQTASLVQQLVYNTDAYTARAAHSPRREERRPKTHHPSPKLSNAFLATGGAYSPAAGGAWADYE